MSNSQRRTLLPDLAPLLLSTSLAGSPEPALNKRFLGEAEGAGFEPSTGLTTRNGIRDRRIRALCHPSGSELKRKPEAEKDGFEPSKEVITPLTP